MNREMVKGVAIGLGVGLLAPAVFPALSRVMRPTFHAAMRAGVAAWDRGRERLAEFGEYAEDLAAEARAQGASGNGKTATQPVNPGQEEGRA